jgi:TRAP-type mannitol/chloroaromatic compound transport system permease small subunit
MAVIIISVVLRYVFGSSSVKLEEFQWHFYGVMIIMAISYAVVSDSHIRLDIYHVRFSRRTKEKIEFFGILFLLLPMIIVIFLHSLDLLADSWRVGERSESPMGLPYRWAFKAFFPCGMGLLVIAALSRLIRAYRFLKKSKG